MQIQNTEMQAIHSLQNNEIKPSTAVPANNLKTTEFTDIYKDQALNKQILLRQKIDTNIPSNSLNIHLGTLNNKNSTVAHLLLKNPELKAKTWSIIHNTANKNKAFNQIPAGSQIYYNHNTGAISWNQSSNIQTPLTPNTSQQVQLTKNNSPMTPQVINQSAATKTTSQPVLLGKLSKQTPTVSELLAHNNDFNAQRWNIIYSDINKNKAFTNIPKGSAIYIDSQTKELSWAGSVNKPSVSDNSRIMASKLDEAVKPFMGSAYKSIDCYTLVVNGLENMGIHYRGKDSLSRQLRQMARSEGRADNAYFTGEGITQAIGNKVYSKAIAQTDNIQQQSQDIFHEIKSLMQKGDILSFSTQSKGHTGIISQNQDQWTFINSGRLDHSINKNSPKKGVGEETLFDEINNWIKLAQERREPLQITIGRLDSRKLA